MNAAKWCGAEAFLHGLSSMGIDHIFASPGSEWAPVWEFLASPELKDKFKYFSSRHEEIAIGMASGYAKATGRLSAVLVHTTVGALHGSMALRAALHENVPMVVFAGESIGFGVGSGPDPGPQWQRNLADIGGPARLVESCVKWSFGVNHNAVLPATIQRACQIAMTYPRGPVFISLPMELMFEVMTAAAPAAAAVPLPSMANPDGIERLADLLVSAKTPVIVTEAAGRNVRTVERLIELAEFIGAPVVETRNPGAVNFPRDHPLHGGFDPLEIVNEADIILLLSSIIPWHPASAAPKFGTVIALSEDPLRTDLPFWGFQVDLCLSGSVEASLDLLLARLKTRDLRNTEAIAERADRWRQRNQERRRLWSDDALACRDHKPIETRWAAYELNQFLPANAAVVEETITHRMPILRLLNRLAPGCAFNGIVGGLGTGLGTALGVKVAEPDRLVVAVIGDGAFNYNPVTAAFGFAQEYRMPIMVVLFNNHGYLSQKMGVPEYYPDGWAVKSNVFLGTSITPKPDYAAVARAFGGYGETVNEPSEIRAALKRGLQAVERDQVALLDVWLEPVN